VEHAIYCVMFKDDCPGYRFVYCIKNKSETLFCFKHRSSCIGSMGNTFPHHDIVD
jgi:hypothetical protein